MNYHQMEYGLRIKEVSYQEIDKIATVPQDEAPDECSLIFGQAVEEHDQRGPFISFGELGQADDDLPELPKETKRAAQIKRWFRRHLPKAKVSWGLIHAQR